MSKFRSFYFILFLSFFHHSFSQNHSKHTPIIQPEERLVENKGQWPDGVLFNTKMEGGKVWFQQHKMIYHLQDYSAMHESHAMKDTSFTSDEFKQKVVHVNFLGSNLVTEIEKTGKSAVYYNFFKGNDQSKWVSDVHSFSSFTLKNFYDGTDFNVSSKGDAVKYELVVKARNNPDIIKLEYSGHNKLFIDTAPQI